MSAEPTPVLSRSGPLKFLNTWVAKNESEEAEQRRRHKGKGPAVETSDDIIEEKEKEPKGASKPAAAAAGGPPPNPKGFFANERTFLSWMQLVLILGALAVGLVNYGDKMGQTAGVIFTVIAMSFMFYALLRFWERADRLQTKEKSIKFEDMIGALILVAVVFLAVAVNFALKFIHR
ncbi:hypothetical protein HDV00_008441 [Rhizophlyctis rosea]|nr:hypothetical protein HDV00_008441 [Rhizophlyctis rosea]